MLAPHFELDGRYTAFGRVISGMDYVDAIEKGEPPATPTRILRASIASDNIPPPKPGETIPSYIAPPPATTPVPPAGTASAPAPPTAPH